MEFTFGLFNKSRQNTPNYTLPMNKEVKKSPQYDVIREKGVYSILKLSAPLVLT